MKPTTHPDLFAKHRQSRPQRKPDQRQPPSARQFRAALELYAPQRTAQDHEQSEEE